ncbi:hypothetical protein Ae201684P_019800 [Aphanomyces euteiches]|uniref:Uncharacterized protein n=1 Tax=Aphanomyces euteiches TaxID=100861 RepID=A0A6G0XDZ6_9STRA|nr:hypothetical protein Ae201684_005680 [Aphanomyces euteiches]KAH9078726.1 hypothetical protein Ae201684P_019800 [Aphanomyces euteiches]
MAKCLFFECHNAADPDTGKCTFHRHRSQCQEPQCSNQAYSKGRCVRHGSRKYCQMDGCMHYRRAGGYCARHTSLLRREKELAPIQPIEPKSTETQDEPRGATPIGTSWLDAIDWSVAIRQLVADEAATDWRPCSDVNQEGNQ